MTRATTVVATTALMMIAMGWGEGEESVGREVGWGEGGWEEGSTAPAVVVGRRTGDRGSSSGAGGMYSRRV